MHGVDATKPGIDITGDRFAAFAAVQVDDHRALFIVADPDQRVPAAGVQVRPVRQEPVGLMQRRAIFKKAQARATGAAHHPPIGALQGHAPAIVGDVANPVVGLGTDGVGQCTGVRIVLGQAGGANAVAFIEEHQAAGYINVHCNSRKSASKVRKDKAAAAT
ncbi:hypothetical protein D3C76_883180 [compost metagenome]